jgi:hypothetical protein
VVNIIPMTDSQIENLNLLQFFCEGTAVSQLTQWRDALVLGRGGIEKRKHQELTRGRLRRLGEGSCVHGVGATNYQWNIMFLFG